MKKQADLNVTRIGDKLEDEPARGIGALDGKCSEGE
jgi:hypothetical protein